MKRILIISFILICLLAYFVPHLNKYSYPSRLTSQKPIKIAMSVWAGFGHAFIAQEEGFFQKNNVNVQLILVSKASDILEMYKNGDIDGGFDVFTDTIVLYSDGYPSKVVYVTDYSDSGDVIIGNPRFKNLSDLKGKKISYSGINTFSQVFVLKALQKANVDESEVQFDVVPEMEVLDALDHGEIDAGHTWEPTSSQALKKGYRVLAKAGDFPGIITGVLFFNKKLIEERPKEVQAIVRALIEAHQFFLYHTSEGIALMSKSMGMTEEEMRLGLKGIQQLGLQDNDLALKPSDGPNSLYVSGKFVTDFMVNTGQLNKVLDFKEIIDDHFINDIVEEKRMQGL